MIRAVLDTNVIVSALLSPAGTPALILLAVHQGLVRPCLSEAILAEYAAVLARPKFRFPPDEIAALLAMLRRTGELVDPSASRLDSPDPGDSKFLHCAEAARAEFLVTGNARHFPDSPYGPTCVVSAAALLERITQEI